MKPCQAGGGGSPMSPLNCKTFRVGVYKRLSLIVGFALDCLRSAFSLKICLVLTSSSAIANNDVIITIRDYALVSRGSRLAARGFAAPVLRFRVQ